MKSKKILKKTTAIIAAMAIITPSIIPESPLSFNNSAIVASAATVTSTEYETFLGNGEQLKAGSSKLAFNGTYKCIMQNDGNFVVYKKNNNKYDAIWSTNTTGTGNYVAMQTDGNLVVYNATGKALWYSNTNRGTSSKYSFKVSSSGIVGIYNNNEKKMLWSNNSEITNGETLYRGDCFSSPDRKYTAIMQHDGNFVLYKIGSTYTAVWSSGTSGKGAVRAVMQGDGNFVLYDSSGNDVWHTNTKYKTNHNYSMSISSGSLCVRNKNESINVWSSKSSLGVNEALTKGQCISSPDRKYRAAMQHDGNFVVYKMNGTPSPEVMWYTGTSGKDAVRAIMQGDGNFVLYNSSGKAVWSSGTCNKTIQNCYMLQLNNDSSLDIVNTKTNENVKRYVKSEKFIWPVPGHSHISSGVGPRWGKKHNGIDIPDGDIEAKVVASRSGKVIDVKTSCNHDYKKSSKCCGDGYGKKVIIQHEDGYETLYAHLSSVNVSEGQYVIQGDIVGKVGCTGHSTGSHLHFEIKKNGAIEDPEKYVSP